MNNLRDVTTTQFIVTVVIIVLCIVVAAMGHGGSESADLIGRYGN